MKPAKPAPPPALPPPVRPHRKTRVTLEKEVAREIVRQRVCEYLIPLTDAQIANACGIKYLVTRDAVTGKFIRVTEAVARTVKGDREEIIEVWEKDPSTPAFTDLMNRALDRPPEQEQSLKIDGTLIVRWK